MGDCREREKEKKEGKRGEAYATAVHVYVCVITFALLMFFLRVIIWLSVKIWRGHHVFVVVVDHLGFACTLHCGYSAVM